MKNLLSKVFNEFKTTQWFSIVTLTSLVSIFIFAGWMGIKDDSIYNKARPYIPILIFITYAFSFFWPIVRLSKKEGHKALGIISCWALFSLTLFGYCLYFFLLNAFPYLKPDDQSKLLNLPPVLIALLGALFGLYVNYQVNSKNQKLKSAFDLMMSTRTSTEFAKNVAALRKVYPPGLEIPVSASVYFFSDSQSNQNRLTMIRLPQ